MEYGIVFEVEVKDGLLRRYWLGGNREGRNLDKVLVK